MDVSKADVIRERGLAIADRAFSHADWERIEDLLVAGRSRNDPRSSKHHDACFTEASRLLRIDDYVNPPDFSNSALLKPSALVERLSDLSGGGLASFRVAVDNTHTSCVIWSPGSAEPATKSVEVLSCTRLGDEKRILYPGLSGGPETRLRVTELIERSAILSTIDAMGSTAVIVLDFHGYGLFRWRPPASPPSSCLTCGRVHGTLTVDQEYDCHLLPVLPIESTPGIVSAIETMWRCRTLASLSVAPGWWHSVATLIFHLLRAAGMWDVAREHLEKIHSDCVMNSSISIKGIESIQDGRLAVEWPESVALMTPAIYDLLRCDTAAEARPVIRRARVQMDAMNWREWSPQCHGLYHICQSADRLSGGVLDPFKDKTMERGHQPVKAAAKKANGEVKITLARANYRSSGERG